MKKTLSFAAVHFTVAFSPGCLLTGSERVGGALGERAPGSYRAYGQLTSIEEEEAVPSAEDMIRQLLIGQETVARTARSVIDAADAANDEPTADLLTQRMQVHEKNAWMLRSMVA